LHSHHAGLDAHRLARIDEHLERNYIAPGKIAGCQVAISRRGRPAYFKSFGLMDRSGTSRSRTTPSSASTR
jgi:CubicO group peptidase (beta-lactamase class C family)